MTDEFTHLGPSGDARMVDVGEKPITARIAEAEGWVHLSRSAFRLLRDGAVPKGDVLATARVAGIQAAKRTDALVPLCHQIPLDAVAVRFELDDRGHRVHIRSEVRARWTTGVEMEALTAVSVAALTLYDMCKAIDRSIAIQGIRLLRKSGGRSGDYTAPDL